MPLISGSCSCDYCGLSYSGGGFTPDNRHHYCCYGCYLVSEIVQARQEEGIAAWLLLRLGIGAFLSMDVMMLSLVLYTTSEQELGLPVVRSINWVMLALSTPAIVILGLPFLTGSLRSLRHGRIGTDILILTGAVSAFLASARHTFLGSGPVYYDTATMLLLIVTLGKLLEANAKSRTSEALRDVMQLLPRTARVLRDGVETEVPTGELRPGDKVAVRPGENIPADGHILFGECSIMESAFTGEARPRPVSPGDSIYGGSANLDGLITVGVTAVGDLSLLGQVRRLVQQAQQQKAPVERLAERVAATFVPIVWASALGAALYWGIGRGDLERATLSGLAVLVVACPCALGFATPIAASLAVGKSARAGVLIRSGEILERLPGIRLIYFDKTGTLTAGTLRVSEILTASEDVNAEELLAWAAAVESGSEHAAARAVVSEASARGIEPGELLSFAAFPGRGAAGEVRRERVVRKVAVGSLRFLTERYELPEKLACPHSGDSLTSIYIGWGSRIQGRIALEDSIRPEAGPAISSLKMAGITTALISGDQKQPAERVARELGIDEIHAERGPAGKAEIIRASALENPDRVAMVGDGINDAPALAEAHVGIAIGGGTDLARQSSDVVLIGDDLSRIPETLALSHFTYRVIRQNLLWAFGYNGIAVISAFLGYVHPLVAALAMLISSLTVIANSMRIQRWGQTTVK
ncbi:MAG: cation-translocating P-type ATPase [Armatimonadetes bacterium]|nr:cation-translocating P-type ATPase [Armatimonadota bacterium]